MAQDETKKQARNEKPAVQSKPLRHDLRLEEGEETEHGSEIRAREPEEGSPPDELGLVETQPA